MGDLWVSESGEALKDNLHGKLPVLLLLKTCRQVVRCVLVHSMHPAM